MTNTSTFDAMKIRIQSFRTHFCDLFNMAIVNVVDESPQIGPCINCFELFLINFGRLVNSLFEPQLIQTYFINVLALLR